jgi:hypothetical protein
MHAASLLATTATRSHPVSARPVRQALNWPTTVMSAETTRSSQVNATCAQAIVRNAMKDNARNVVKAIGLTVQIAKPARRAFIAQLVPMQAPVQRACLAMCQRAPAV